MDDCQKICKYVDDVIKNNHELKNFMRKQYGKTAETKHAYIGAGYAISAFKAFKEYLNKQDICKCE